MPVPPAVAWQRAGKPVPLRTIAANQPAVARFEWTPPASLGTNVALLALCTGAGALAFGFPFLTTHTAHVALPGIGVVHLPSAAVFDLGVFAVVLGSTLLLLTALAHQSLRVRRKPAPDAAGEGAG